jgi:hypothetical protein
VTELEKSVDSISHARVEVVMIKISTVETIGIFVNHIGSQPSKASIEADDFVELKRAFEMVVEFINVFMYQILYVGDGLLGKVLLNM